MTAGKGGEAAISENVVILKTGKSSKEWFEILDEWGATRRTHKEIARYLADNWKVSPWWSQTITVRYEQDRGLRSPGQRSDGYFAVSIRRTIRTKPSKGWRALIKPQELRQWFFKHFGPEDEFVEMLSNRSSSQDRFFVFNEPTHLGFTWKHSALAPESIVDFTVENKAEDRVLLTLEHGKIALQKDYLDLRSRWEKAMDALKLHLEA